MNRTVLIFPLLVAVACSSASHHDDDPRLNVAMQMTIDDLDVHLGSREPALLKVYEGEAAARLTFRAALGDAESSDSVEAELSLPAGNALLGAHKLGPDAVIGLRVNGKRYHARAGSLELSLANFDGAPEGARGFQGTIAGTFTADDASTVEASGHLHGLLSLLCLQLPSAQAQDTVVSVIGSSSPVFEVDIGEPSAACAATRAALAL